MAEEQGSEVEGVVVKQGREAEGVTGEQGREAEGVVVEQGRKAEMVGCKRAFLKSLDPVEGEVLKEEAGEQGGRPIVEEELLKGVWVAVLLL